jgi:hypothetical protein
MVTSLFENYRKIQTKGEQILFLSLTEDSLPNLGSPNCKRSDVLSKTSQESRTSVRASHFIMAEHLIIHSAYPFSQLHGENGGIGLDLFTNLSILFHCLILTRQKCTLGFRFQSNPK